MKIKRNAVSTTRSSSVLKFKDSKYMIPNLSPSTVTVVLDICVYLLHEYVCKELHQYDKKLRERPIHISANLIEIQQKFLQWRHGLHELRSQMESNDTLYGSELVPHWALGPKKSKFGPMGPKFFAQQFIYTKLITVN